MSKPRLYTIVTVDPEHSGALLAMEPLPLDDARQRLFALDATPALLFASPPIPWSRTVEINARAQRERKERKPRADKGTKRTKPEPVK